MWQEDDRSVKALPTVFWISTTLTIRESIPIVVIFVDSLEQNNLFYPGTKPPECPREPYEARFQVFPLPRNFGDISGICSPGFFFFLPHTTNKLSRLKKLSSHMCVGGLAEGGGVGRG
jgi:hypothetical protein